VKHLALLLLLGCATSHEAHSEAKIEAANQEEVRLETHTEEGAWSVRTWQFAPRGAKGGDVPESVAASAAAVATPGFSATVGVAAPAASDDPHPSFLGWPTEGEVISYSEEVHQPTTTIDATKDAQEPPP
jgi:hypothetical protein